MLWRTNKNLSLIPGRGDDPGLSIRCPSGVPACQTIQFKFIIIRADGSMQWENESNHS
ncbi:MAG: hypothetical protein JO011_12760 [Ktedonobacteraceae bacterium]|nr:hypothetical protein [Ktedonobacteraceae bacterium]